MKIEKWRVETEDNFDTKIYTESGVILTEISALIRHEAENLVELHNAAIPCSIHEKLDQILELLKNPPETTEQVFVVEERPCPPE